jgi:outer membrane protein TolC
MRNPIWWPAAAGVLVILLAAPAHGQDVLTLEEATGRALAHNAGLRASEEDMAARHAQVAEARSAWFPRIAVSESWQRGDQPVFVFSSLLASRRFAGENFAIDALNHPDAISLHRTSIGIEQPLFDGRQRAEVERARQVRDLAGLTLDETRAALAVTTAEAYGRIVAAEAARRAADSALQAARADRARAADRRDAGMATDADVLALDAHVASLVQRVVQAGADAAIALAELNRLMGAPVDQSYQVAEAPAPPTTSASSDVSALLTEAEAARPALRRATTLRQLAQTERRVARASRLPNVTAQAGVEVGGLRFDDRASSWLVGAEMRWSLSLGGAERARLRAASHAEARAAAEAEDARAAVHVEVMTALAEQRSAAARLEAGRAAVAQARESERIVRDRFEAGLASVTDLLRAQSASIDAVAGRTAASVDAMVSAARLARALGRHP